MLKPCSINMATGMDPVSIFVYGTLKPGEANYDRYCKGRVISETPAIALGYLYALPVGYPAMVAVDRAAELLVEHRSLPPKAMVWGYRLQFRESACLRLLDELEDYCPQRSPHENEYYRRSAPLFTPDHQALGKAWVYLMEPQRVRRMAGRLVQGQWTGGGAYF